MQRREFLFWAGLALSGAPAAFGAEQDAAGALRAAFRETHKGSRERVAGEKISTETHGDLLYEKWRITTARDVLTPILLVRAQNATGRQPAILCLHGLGGNKEGMGSYLQRFARSGFAAVAIDARYHGERAGDVQAAMGEAFKTGKEHPYLWDTAWDTWRVMDYLQTRPDVDPERLGVMGISLGGHTTWMVSADPRVKVAVPCISVCSWRWQLEHQGYKQRVSNLSKAFAAVCKEMGEPEVNPRVVAEAWKRWLPGIPEKYDCQDVLAAMAPRPLLILNGDSDPVAPLDGVKAAYSVIEEAYKKAGAADHLRLIVAEKSGHTVSSAQQDAMLEWFERWLKK